MVNSYKSLMDREKKGHTPNLGMDTPLNGLSKYWRSLSLRVGPEEVGVHANHQPF